MTRPIPPHGTEGRRRGSKSVPPCACDRCIRAVRHAQIRRELGRARHGANTIPRKPLVEHIAHLRAHGMTLEGIARAADVSRSLLTDIITGRVASSRRAHALRLLAVEPRVDAISPRPAVGTIRRVRALQAIGHSQATIAAATGMSTEWVSHLANARYRHVSAGTAEAMRRAYRQLCITPGGSVLSRRRAAEAGWHGPLAWGEDIDDPDASPEGDTAPRLDWQEQAQLRAEEVRHLAAAGCSQQEIAARVGCSASYVRELLAGRRGPGWRARQQEVAA